GMLAFLELTAPPRWFDLVFGLLAGWWLFADRDVRPDHATLPAAGWLKLLRQHGFDDCIAIGDGGEVESGAHTVLLARAAQGEPALAGAPVMSVMPAVSGRAAGQVPLLLLADEAGIAEALAEELRVLGREVAVIGASEASASAIWRARALARGSITFSAAIPRRWWICGRWRSAVRRRAKAIRHWRRRRPASA
ncbi:MAG TPA: hypothetical protein PK405_09315, partial [Hyphomicrobiales bacterium]|nr:hypothetical protein [Hyphomicrobiales bacterium]